MKYRIEEQDFGDKGSMFYVQSSNDNATWCYTNVGPFSYLDNARLAIRQLMNPAKPKDIKITYHNYP